MKDELKDYIATLKDQCEEQERFLMLYTEKDNTALALYHTGQTKVLNEVITVLEELVK